MRRLKMLWHIIQVTGFTRFALSFVTFVFGSGGVLFLVEPAIINYYTDLNKERGEDK